MRRTRTKHDERGAAAVEFALVLLPLCFILLGIIDFGWVFNQQVSVTNAAREAARYYAVHQSQTFSNADCSAATDWTSCAQQVGKNAAPSIASSSWTASGSGITITSTCSAGGGPAGSVSVTAIIPLQTLTGFFTPMFGSSSKLKGVGQTICGG